MPKDSDGVEIPSVSESKSPLTGIMLFAAGAVLGYFLHQEPEVPTPPPCPVAQPCVCEAQTSCPSAASNDYPEAHSTVLSIDPIPVIIQGFVREE